MGKKLSIDMVFSEYNMEAALKIVTKKKPMAGLDGLSAIELEGYWKKNKNAVLKEIKEGNYSPVPLFIFFKNKPGKKEKRQISVCSVRDQMLQHCLRLELEKVYIPSFHRNSYGFIKGRGTQEALLQCCRLLNKGLTYVVDTDIRKCFDSIKHRIIVDRIGRVSKDSVVDLISKYLKNPGMIGDTVRHHRVGVPQGSCLSPLLANIVLNNLDWYLYRNKISFVRYADDLVVFCGSNTEASQALILIKEYLEKELSLHLNMEKTSILRAEELHYLGYAFCKLGDKYMLAVDDQIKDKMIKKMQKHLRKKDGSKDEMLDRIGAFNRGWINYYGKAYPPTLIEFLNNIQEEEIERLKELLDSASSSPTETMEVIYRNKGFVLPIEWYDEVRERSGL